ncbi:cysteine-rich-repeat containing protein [Artemisia annua]|uniref:Cysteine-rich-repeat containing protein n=1 Tax=Artemisia annua TaxID=35608 RepID=A0A2U1P0U6_ARTAN|nr:cysteine-rich-repeat containing protein [Artemisia annua]
MEMKSIFLYIFFVQTIIHGGNFAIAQYSFGKTIQDFRCRNTGNFKGTNYEDNRNTALSHLVQKIRTPRYTGYCYASEDAAGKADRVNVVALCPPNVRGEGCEECIKKTIPYIKEKCPKQKEAVAWSIISNLYTCMVLYMDRDILAPGLHDWVWASFSFPKADANVAELQKALNSFAPKMQEEAAPSNNFSMKFATGSVHYGSTTLYMSMQCTPFLLKENCIACLSKATKEIHRCCTGKGFISGMAVSPYCVLRYDHEIFYNNNSPKIYSRLSSSATSGTHLSIHKS